LILPYPELDTMHHCVSPLLVEFYPVSLQQDEKAQENDKGAGSIGFAPV